MAVSNINLIYFNNMLSKTADERMAEWLELRHRVEDSDSPLELISDFWSQAPFIPYNRHIDPYNRPSWPTPWEILVENKYDDFTRAIMMAYSVKYTKRYSNALVEVRTYFNETRNQMFNVVCIDQQNVLNYKDGQVISYDDIPHDLCMDNLVTIN